MADGCYNHIYSVLVENEQDTLGIIASSLCKRQKIEFIQAFKTKHDREPKDEDLALIEQVFDVTIIDSVPASEAAGAL